MEKNITVTTIEEDICWLFKKAESASTASNARKYQKGIISLYNQRKRLIKKNLSDETTQLKNEARKVTLATCQKLAQEAKKNMANSVEMPNIAGTIPSVMCESIFPCKDGASTRGMRIPQNKDHKIDEIARLDAKKVVSTCDAYKNLTKDSFIGMDSDHSTARYKKLLDKYVRAFSTEKQLKSAAKDRIDDFEDEINIGKSLVLTRG